MATIGDPGKGIWTKDATEALKGMKKAMAACSDAIGGEYAAERQADLEIVTKLAEIAKAQNRHLYWYLSGARILAALLWLSFVATVFLIMFRAVTPDVISGSAAAMFFILAVLVSFSVGNK